MRTNINYSAVEKAWALLDGRERRNAFKLLSIMIVGAFASAAMVGSVFPFLSVLSNPELIRTVDALNWAYKIGGFTSDYGFLTALGAASITVIIVSNAILIYQTWLIARFTHNNAHLISRRLLSHYLSQPYEFFLDKHSGNMSTNILAEIHVIVGQYIRPLADLISSALTVAAVVIMLLITNPTVASLTLGSFAVIYGSVTWLSRRFVHRMGTHRAIANKERYRVVGEALGAIKEVKLLGRESRYLDQYNDASTELAKSQIGVAVLSNAPRYAIQIVAFGGIIVLCLFLIDAEGLQEPQALSGILPIVGILAFAGQRLMPEFQKLYQSFTQMTAGTAALERVYGDFAEGISWQLDVVTPKPMGLRSALKLDKIKYSYPSAEGTGLNDISVTIGAGERIGVVGPSGAGKTTLADVILGLLHPQSGNIEVDGSVLTSKTIRSWQQSVGYVPQDIFLADITLAENIALGLRPEEIDHDKVEQSAQIAQLHQFVSEDMLEGYATKVGERGVRLSGGQRQRIGIARALYHNADLIVFDEATSALDSLTEREVISAIEALPSEKTILLIAHRLTTVRQCDKILLLENGRVSAYGPWESLVEQNLTFRKIAGLDG